MKVITSKSMGRYYDERRIRTDIYDKREPKDTAIITFIAFNLLGIIPLSPFVVINIIGTTDISSNHAFIISSVFTAISFFLIGIIKAKIVKKS